ncbi:MFS transporter [Nocardia sp. NPDC052112]|uniref:MFS transporter n=1 Tax=Nocardia sp. NPDC052112 TaxID=3155646 RepID=UPI00341C520F
MNVATNEPVRARYPLLSAAGFLWFWSADSLSMVGTYITALALQVLAVETLRASPIELGVLAAARWLPYLLFGLIAGVLVDRYRRRPVLVTADLVRAGLLAVIPLSATMDVLSMSLLIAIVVFFGTVSLTYDAAHQSFLPSLVPPELLTPANARLEQSSAVAQTCGPVIGGWLVRIVGAPLAIMVDAASYLISGLIVARLRVTERSDPPPDRNLRLELREGLAWVYGHRMLAPLAIASHGWFFFSAMVSTVYVLFVIDELGFGASTLGLTFASGGVGAVAGASVADHAGRRFGIGPMIIGCRWLTPVGYALIPLAHNGVAGLPLLCAAQFLFGVSIGVDSPLEMGYRQSVTPDRLLGRMNATMRSLNRAAIVVGAPIGGVLAAWLGIRWTVWIAVVGLLISALALTTSGFRHARSDVVAPR